MTMTSVFAEITKTAPQADGSIFVYGKATGSDLDLDGQRCDPVWLRQAMPEFMKIGNVREQHDAKRAVGKAIEHDVKDDGHYIKARIVDPVAVAKTQAGIFTGFSIGVKSPVLEKSTDAPNGLIAGGQICEISLVDRPCLPTATLTVCKAAKPGMQLRASDFDAQRMLVRVEELVEKATDVENLEAPAPGQKCADCGEDGHVKCGDMTVTLADRLDPEQAALLASKVGEDVEKSSSMSGCGCCGNCTSEKAVEFDRDAAKALVEKTVADADAGLGEDESPDINGALQAISIIAELIQREAIDLGTMPAQGCDIDLLMSAVHALRMFVCREAKEQAGIDPGAAPIMLTADADLIKASKEPYGDVEYADPGYQSDGKKRYPIDTAEHAKAAWSYINQSDNAAEYSASQLKSIKSKIMAACKKFGIDVDADAKKGVDVETVAEKTAEKAVEETVKSGLLTLDEAHESLANEVAEKAVAPEETVEVEKTVDAETTKAAVEPDAESLVKAVSAALEKVFSTDELEKSDNPIRKVLGDIVSAANESTVKSVNALTERLEAVEQMATPGGPATRRTEVERAASRRGDLEMEAAHYKSLAMAAEDPILRRGYATKAAQLEAQVKAL